LSRKLVVGLFILPGVSIVVSRSLGIVLEILIPGLILIRVFILGFGRAGRCGFIGLSGVWSRRLLGVLRTLPVSASTPTS